MWEHRKIFNPFMTEVPTIKKPVFVEKINGLVSMIGTSVMKELMYVWPFFNVYMKGLSEFQLLWM